MNVLLSPQPSLFQHQHSAARGSPSSHLSQYTMSGNKRKATEDLESSRMPFNDGGFDDVSMSPSPSPAISNRNLARPSKRFRGNDNITGRPLALPRLLETLDAQSLRSVLQAICNSHPAIGAEVVASAPRPSVNSTLEVLERYKTRLLEAFPYGSGPNDYAYSRVRGALTSVIEAISDYTPHYLPPNETNVTNALEYLDGATNIIHDLPDWINTSHKHHKDTAYDEIARAWALVISEASKRGGGFQLHNGEWDQKVAKHNEKSQGKMAAAVQALGSNLGWMGGRSSGDTGQRERENVRNELLSGTYGQGMPVRLGAW